MRRIDITNGPYFPKVGDTVELTLLNGDVYIGTVCLTTLTINGKYITIRYHRQANTCCLFCPTKNGAFTWKHGAVVSLHLILGKCPFG